MVWSALPYHWEVIGWPSDIAQVTREQANEFYATYYAPNNVTAILVGDFDPEKAWALAQRYFSRIPANPRGVPEVVTQEPPQAAEQRMTAEAEATPSVELAFKTVPGVHRDAPALQLLASILGGSGGGGRPGAGGPSRAPSGRLYKALVLDKKVATRATASSRGQRHGGLFTLTANPAPGHRTDELEPMLASELERVAREGVTGDELARAKKGLEMAHYVRLETNTGLRDALAQAESGGSYRDLQAAPARIQAVTREEVQRVAKAYFGKEGRNVLVMNRKGSAPEGAPRRRGTPAAEVK